MNERIQMFPILGDTIIRALPWPLLKPHEKQAIKNHGGQTLNQLAGRGGLGIEEAYCVLKDMDFPFGAKWNKEAVRIALMKMAQTSNTKLHSGRIDPANQPEKLAVPQLSGDACRHCGNFALVRTGTCQTCQACGETSGCS